MGVKDINPKDYALAADCIAVDAAKIADAALAEEARTRGGP